MALLDHLTWWLWLSPGVACFLFLNVLVAAIAVTSRSASTRSRLCRSASSMVLDRLRSLAKQTSVEFCYWISPEADEPQVSRAAPDLQLAVPAAIPTMSENADDDESPAGVVVNKSMSSDDGNVTCTLSQEGRHAQEQEQMPTPPPAAAAPAAAVVTTETAAAMAEFVKPKHHRREHVYAVEGKAELNARADQFIRQFRHELQLQRLDSMLGRRAHSTGSGAPQSG